MIKNTFLKFINFIIPKKKNYIFAEPISNCLNDCYDLLNYSGDSLLSFINYTYNNYSGDTITLNLVIYHIDRLDKYLLNNNSHIIIKPIVSPKASGKSFSKKVLYFLSMFRSSRIICESIPSVRPIVTRKQKLFCLSYFASFKSDFNTVNCSLIPKRWELICSSSLLDSVIKSSAFEVPISCFKPFGLCRNDSLGGKEKKSTIFKWIREKTGLENPKIIIYAPTYRDYETSSNSKRNIFGYENVDSLLNFLKDNNVLIIAKLHPLQERSVIEMYGENVVLYEKTFLFSLYDLMAVSDVLITDYSSIGLDWLLTNKPIIYNLYDFDLYKKVRGMAFEPFEHFCAGLVAYCYEDFLQAIKKSIHDSGETKDIRNLEYVKPLMFKYADFNSCKRVFDYIFGDKK